MQCRKCHGTIPEGSRFCNLCGVKQSVERSAKRRGNGNGTAYRCGNGWAAEYTLDWTVVNGELKRKRVKKTGFRTKQAALEHIQQMKLAPLRSAVPVKFKDLYAEWLERHADKVTQSTVNCYKSAYKYYAPLYYAAIEAIKTEQLQRCIDACPHGTRTKENMKALGTSLFRYAMQLDIVDRNYAEYLYVPKGPKSERVAFTGEQLRRMWESVSTVPDVKYILVLCYTGMRLGEMLSAKTESYHPEERYFVAGSKTAAGKDRILPISPRLLPFFRDFGVGEYLFFAEKTKRSEPYFREKLFYPTLERLGMDVKKPDGTHLYTPHCCRHTFATLMKEVPAPPTDKQKLIGHSKFEMTAYYTHTDLESLRKIVDNL